MMSMPTSSSPRQPIKTAMGRKTAAKRMSLKALHTRVSRRQPAAFLRSMQAPSATSPSGVAVAAKLETVRWRMTGCGMPSTDQRSPAKIPRMMGLVTMPRRVLPTVFRSSRPPSGESRVRTTTAATL